MISNVIHYVYPAWPNTRPLSYVNYICIKSAIERHKPKDVKFWIDGDPVDNEWWQKIKPMVSIHRKEMRGEFGGTKIEWPQYQSDVVRLEILRDEGGIYLDTDVIVLEPFDAMLGERFIISKEPSEDSLCNAIILSEANHPFVDAWLQEMPNALKSTTWAQGGVRSPFELMQTWGDDIDVLDAEIFCPFDLNYPYMFEPKLNRAARALTELSYTIHLYETYWRDVIANVTPAWCETTDCMFAQIAKGNYP